MTAAQAPREVRDVLAGRPGAVNRLIKRFGKPIVDYATALIPDRSAPFEAMVEDILVDVIAQSRGAARSQSDEQVFEFVAETALRTVRARYREVLDAQPTPAKATSSYSVKEVLERTGMSQADLTAGISEGRIRAVRAHDELRVKPDGIQGLSERKANNTFLLSAAERELLCLHFRLGFSPEVIGRWAGVTPAQMEAMIGKAAARLAEGIAGKSAGGGQDNEIRRYIDGRMDGEETAKFERRMIKDKIAQKRLDELRSQSDQLRALFDSEAFDLSSIAVNVRRRNPHHALSLPPVAALWIQVVGIAAVLLIFHSVGSYIAPPAVTVTSLAGEASHVSARAGRATKGEGDTGHALLTGESARMLVGDVIETPAGAQARLVLDGSNRVLLAPGSRVRLLEPRNDARQVLELSAGEVWGRFASSGYPFAVRFGPEHAFEIASDAGAEFVLVSGDLAAQRLPDNLSEQRFRALAAAFRHAESGGLEVVTSLRTYAGFEFSRPGGDVGLRAGDLLESAESLQLEAPADLASIAARMKDDESINLTVRRDAERVSVVMTRRALKPLAVVRVFHGALMCGPASARTTLMNGGQWAVFMDGQPAMVGLRGFEDYRVLRIDARQMFKEQLHWLNTESFPLRAENSVLGLDRELRDIAAGLEKLREDRITRSGPAELETFEMIMRRAIDDARARINAGEPREALAPNTLSDAALVASEDEIIGAILHWRRQATAGVHDTIGSAAKTLASTIQRHEDDLELRGEEITRAILMQEEIERIEAQIVLQDQGIAELEAGELFDRDGSLRAAIDARIKELEADVRAGDDANSRINLLRIRLNELDSRIDTERRKLPGLRTAVADAQAALDQLDGQIARNIFTPERMKAAQSARDQLADHIGRLQTEINTQVEAVAAGDRAVKEAVEAQARADVASSDLQVRLEAAQEALEDAILERNAAQARQTAAQEALDTAQAEYDAIPEEETEAREAARDRLEAARKALSEAADAAKAAVDAAEAANRAHNAAAAEAKSAAEALAARKTALAEARAALEAAAERRDTKQAELDRTRSEHQLALAEVQELAAAKEALDALKTRRETAQGVLADAQSKLQAVEKTIEDLEADAQPRRDQLTKELAVVDKATAARADIAALRTQRGRHQAIDEDIERRRKDRAELVSRRRQLEGSNLIVQFETLKDEYNALSRRIDALKFLRARGLQEDANFAHEQVSALDAFRDAAASARARAVAALDQFCPPYEHAAYVPFSKMYGSELRQAVLLALWMLYYDDGVYAATGDEGVCYYVAVRAGEGPRVLSAIDERWRTYLTQVLGAEGFERAAQLTPAELRPETPEVKD